MKKLIVIAVLAVFVCTGLVYAAEKSAKDPVTKAVIAVTDTAESAVTGTANVAKTTVSDTGETAKTAVDTVADTANTAVSGTQAVVETVTGTGTSE